MGEMSCLRDENVNNLCDSAIGKYLESVERCKYCGSALGVEMPAYYSLASMFS